MLGLGMATAKGEVRQVAGVLMVDAGHALTTLRGKMGGKTLRLFLPALVKEAAYSGANRKFRTDAVPPPALKRRILLTLTHG